MSFPTADPREIAAAYRASAVENAPPVVVVRLLFEHALRTIASAEACDPVRQPAAFAKHLARADATVVELRLALAHEAAPDISRRLEQLYLFVETRLHDALRQRDCAPIAEARSILAILLDAWTRIDLGPSATAA